MAVNMDPLALGIKLGFTAYRAARLAGAFDKRRSFRTSSFDQKWEEKKRQLRQQKAIDDYNKAVNDAIRSAEELQKELQDGAQEFIQKYGSSVGQLEAVLSRVKQCPACGGTGSIKGSTDQEVLTIIPDDLEDNAADSTPQPRVGRVIITNSTFAQVDQYGPDFEKGELVPNPFGLQTACYEKACYGCSAFACLPCVVACLPCVICGIASREDETCQCCDGAGKYLLVKEEVEDDDDIDFVVLPTGFTELHQKKLKFAIDSVKLREHGGDATFNVTVPPGAMPGTTMSVLVPAGMPFSGEPVQFMVPPGAVAGQTIAVPLPNTQLQPPQVEPPPAPKLEQQAAPPPPPKPEVATSQPRDTDLPSDDLKSWLDKHSLGRIEDQLRAIGATAVDDLSELDASDLDDMDLKPLEKKRLLRALGKN